MNWKMLTTDRELDDLIAASAEKPQVIFKHSTRCSISAVVKTRLERDFFPDTVDFHYLDLIRYRALSNRVAEDFHVEHESPQVLVIRNGQCVYDESHSSIRMDDVLEQTTAAG